MAEKEITGFKLDEIVKKILIGLSLILLILSVFGLYMALNEVISLWVGYKYAPIYRSMLNIGVLLLSIYVLTILLKK